MTSNILCPISVEFHGFRYAGPAILVVPALVGLIYFSVSSEVWIYRWHGKNSPADSLETPFTAPFKDEKSLFSHQLDEILQQELDLKKDREEIQRSIEDLPKQHEERQLKRQQLMRERAKVTPTSYGLAQPARKVRSVERSSNRMTQPEKRSARNQLLLLSAILAVILLLLWKSLH